MNGRALLIGIMAIGAMGLFLFAPSWVSFQNLWLSSSSQLSSETIDALRVENEHLKAMIATFGSLESLKKSRGEGVGASVYSRYPFNFKSELLIDKGTTAGVFPHAPVVAVVGDSSVFVGRVISAFRDSAVVQTIFDTRSQVAARIGTKGVDTLLQGGPTPRLTLIPKDATVNPGDVVYTASPDVPYGVPIGEVQEIKASGDTLFRDATLRFSYDINSLRAIRVLTSHAESSREK